MKLLQTVIPIILNGNTGKQSDDDYIYDELESN